jgi:hypothetical protein
MEEFKITFQQAVKSLQIADHMTYVTFPLVQDKRLLLKIFDEVCKSITNCLRTIIYYENPITKPGIQTIHKYAQKYTLSNQQIKQVFQILELNKKHKQSAMEFVRDNRIIILSDNLKTQSLDLQIIKQYLLLAKELFMITKEKVPI